MLYETGVRGQARPALGMPVDRDSLRKHVASAAIAFFGVGALLADEMVLDGRDDWRDTGVDVVAGEPYHVSAEGWICTEPTCNPCCVYDPSGYRSDGSTTDWPAPEGFPAPGLRPYSLVGRVAGSTIQLGANLVFVAPESGRLEVIFNDTPRTDNSGTFTIDIATIGAPCLFARVLEAGWQDPALAVDDQRTVHIVAVSADRKQFVYLTWRDGVPSTPQFSPTLDASIGIGGASMDVSPAGGVVVAFNDNPTFGDWGAHMLARASLDGWEWPPIVIDGSPCGYGTSVAVDPEGYVHTIYRIEQDVGLKYWTDRPALAAAVGFVEASGCNVGRYGQLALDAARIPHLAYSSWSSCGAKYATWNGQMWQTTDLASTGAGCPAGSFRVVSLALDSAEMPRIVCHNSEPPTTAHFALTVDGWCCSVASAVESRYTNIQVDSLGNSWVRCEGNYLKYGRFGPCPASWDTMDCCPFPPTWNLGGNNRYFRIGSDDTKYLAGWTVDDGVAICVTPRPCLPCDTNCDGSVNGFDVESFAALLNGTGMACSSCAGDASGDGSVNGFDIAGFRACLGVP